MVNIILSAIFLILSLYRLILAPIDFMLNLGIDEDNSDSFVTLQDSLQANQEEFQSLLDIVMTLTLLAISFIALFY